MSDQQQELLTRLMKRYPEMRIRTDSQLYEDEEQGNLYVRTANGMLQVHAQGGDLVVKETTKLASDAGLKQVQNISQRVGD